MSTLITNLWDETVGKITVAYNREKYVNIINDIIGEVIEKNPDNNYTRLVINFPQRREFADLALWEQKNLLEVFKETIYNSLNLVLRTGDMDLYLGEKDLRNNHGIIRMANSKGGMFNSFEEIEIAVINDDDIFDKPLKIDRSSFKGEVYLHFSSFTFDKFRGTCADNKVVKNPDNYQGIIHFLIIILVENYLTMLIICTF